MTMLGNGKMDLNAQMYLGKDLPLIFSSNKHWFFLVNTWKIKYVVVSKLNWVQIESEPFSLETLYWQACVSVTA